MESHYLTFGTPYWRGTTIFIPPTFPLHQIFRSRRGFLFSKNPDPNFCICWSVTHTSGKLSDAPRGTQSSEVTLVGSARKIMIHTCNDCINPLDSASRITPFSRGLGYSHGNSPFWCTVGMITFWGFVFQNGLCYQLKKVRLIAKHGKPAFDKENAHFQWEKLKYAMSQLWAILNSSIRTHQKAGKDK